MRRAERIAAIERGLTLAAQEAQARGWILIYGVAEAVSEDGERGGCCVTKSLDHAKTFAGRRGRSLPFSKRDVCDEFDAIESGWDGLPFKADLGQVSARSMFPTCSYDFYRLGARLRRKLAPLPAESLGMVPS